MATVEGPISTTPGPLPPEGKKVSSRSFLNKEWSNATERLNFSKVSEVLTTYLGQDTSVDDAKALIAAVELLSDNEDLPPLSDLMEVAGVVNKAKSSAAKILIAAQLFRLNKEKYRGLKKADREKVIKSLFLRGRSLIEKSKSIKENVTFTRRINTDVIVLATLISTINVVANPLIGPVASTYLTYEAQRKHHAADWNTKKGLTLVVKRTANHAFQELKKIPARRTWKKI
jgi:hypothetical protein